MIQPLSLTVNSISIDEEIEFNLEDLLIDPDEDVEPPTPIIQFKNTDKDGKVKVIDLLTEDNISMLQGPAKGRKSGLIKILATTVQGLENELMFSYYQRNNVAIFDTEQSKWHCRRAARTIRFMSKKKINYVKLTGLSVKNKKHVVEQYLKQNQDCGFIILDNIVHFLSDFNSSTESSDLCNWLLYVKSEYQVHILTVLHENPDAFGSKKARGHLGTNLTNLCETIIRVEKDQHNRGQSIVSPKECRNEEFDEFLITVDGQNTPQAIKRTSEPIVKKSGY